MLARRRRRARRRHSSTAGGTYVARSERTAAPKMRTAGSVQRENRRRTPGGVDAVRLRRACERR